MLESPHAKVLYDCHTNAYMNFFRPGISSKSLLQSLSKPLCSNSAEVFQFNTAQLDMNLSYKLDWNHIVDCPLSASRFSSTYIHGSSNMLLLFNLSRIQWCVLHGLEAEQFVVDRTDIAILRIVGSWLIFPIWNIFILYFLHVKVSPLWFFFMCSWRIDFTEGKDCSPFLTL